jgi:hypothetical protein
LKTLNYKSWVPFHWHGLGLEIPADWNPGKLVGDWKSGNVRLDDQMIPRVELEWKEARGDERVALIVDRYVEGLAKGAEKQRHKLKVDRSASCPGLALSGDLRSQVYFVWESQYTVHTLACYSPTSDRLLFVRVMAQPDEELSAVLPRVLNSLSDEDATAGQTWALFDLSATSPAGYELESYELKSGHIRLKFQQGRSIYQVDRLSLAGMLLQRRSLDAWYRDFFRKDLRHIDVTTDPAGTDEAPLLTISGTPRGRLRSLLMPLPFWSSRPRLHLAGRAWVAAEANKILVVQSFYRRPSDALDIEACARDVIPLQ